MNFSFCPDSIPNFLRIFDISIAPPLLYYAYLPILALSLILGVFVVRKDNYSDLSKLFFGLTFSFATWICLILLQWIAVQVEIVHLSWQLLLLPEVSIYIFSLYFCYEYLFRKHPPKTLYYLISSTFVCSALLLPTKFNIQSFDLTNCEGVVGLIWNYVYIFEPICLLVVAFMGIERYRQARKNNGSKSPALLSVGMILFLGIFWASNFYGEITKIYEINLVGPIGMLIFLSLLTYLIIKFHTFNIKLFSSQALVVSIWLLTAGLLFINNLQLIHIILLITFILLIIIGIQLIKGVKREVEARERIEKLAIDLQKSNDGQSNLIHIMNHQIKGYLAKARGIFSELLTEPAYGPVSDAAKPMIDEGLRSLTEGVEFVGQVLNGSSAASGTLVYTMKPTDVKTLVEEDIQMLHEKAEKKGLTIKSHMDEGNYTIQADTIQLKEALRNLIDNSIIYTEKGGLTISLTHHGDRILFTVKDTGVGILPEDKSKLFTKGGRGKDALRINVNSTGYGLAFVKGVIDAHKGKVWVDSDGAGKGSTFSVEIPIHA